MRNENSVIFEHEGYQEVLDVLLNTSNRLLTASTKDEIATITAKATKVLGNDLLCAVYIVQGERLIPTGVTKKTSRFSNGPYPYDIDQDLPIPRAFKSAEHKSVEEVHQIDDDRSRDPLQKELIFPLGQYGVLVLGLPPDTGLSPAQRRLGEILAANTTAALHRVSRENDLRDWGRSLKTLYLTTQQLMQATSQEQIAEIIVDTARNLLDLPAVGVFMLDEENGALIPVATSDDKDILRVS